MDCRTNKQIYNQIYAETHVERMKNNASINYGQHRETILLKRAYERYMCGCRLRRETVDKLAAAGFSLTYRLPKYLQTSSE